MAEGAVLAFGDVGVAVFALVGAEFGVAGLPEGDEAGVLNGPGETKGVKPRETARIETLAVVQAALGVNPLVECWVFRPATGYFAVAEALGIGGEFGVAVIPGFYVGTGGLGGGCFVWRGGQGLAEVDAEVLEALATLG